MRALIQKPGAPVAGLRAVAVTMSPLLRDVITTLLTYHVAVEVVAVFDTRAESEKWIEDVDPNLILVGLQPGESDEIAATLLTRLPNARIVAISHDGRRVSIHETRPHCRILADVQPQGMVDAILAACTSRKN
jgi:chemotaxis response regulator CheB